MNLNELGLLLYTSFAIAGIVSFRVCEHSNWFWFLTKVSSRQIADSLVAILVSAYISIFGALSILSYLSFSIAGFDLGIFDQAVWNSLHGRLLENTIVPDAPLLIGQRFSPILLALVPMYAVWTSPIILLLVQTVALGTSAFPLYWVARQRIGRLWGLTLVIVYLLFPALQYVNLFEFHEVSLSVPLFALAVFFLLRQRYEPLLICLGLVLLVKEELSFTVLLFGVYIGIVQRRRLFGFGIAVFAITWAVFLLQYLLPFFRGSEGYYYFSHGAAGGAIDRYGYLGSSLSEIITTLVTRPQYVLQHILTLPKIEFVLLLLAPLVFIPLLSPEILMLAVPTLAISLLSDLDVIYSIKYHYTAPALAFLFFAMVIGLERILSWNALQARNRAWCAALGVLLLAASTMNYYLVSPGPLSRNYDATRYALTAHTWIGESIFRLVPNDAIVVAQTGLIPHLTNRRRVYEFPGTEFPWQAEYLIADTSGSWYQRFRRQWDERLNSGYFQFIAQNDGFLLARRIASPNFPDLLFGDRIALYRSAMVFAQTLRGGQPVFVQLEWLALENIREHYLVEIRITDDRGHSWLHGRFSPCFDFCPTEKWDADKFVSDYQNLDLPPTMPTGVYTVTGALYDPAREKYLPVTDRAMRSFGDQASIGTLWIEKNKSSVPASQLHIEQPLFVDMQEIRFLGSTATQDTIAPGELFQVGLNWRARSKPRGDYVVSVQLRDAKNRVVYEETARPAAGAYPTTEWDEGEVLLDWHDLTIPTTFAPGEYQIVIVLRDAATRQQLGEAKLEKRLTVR